MIKLIVTPFNITYYLQFIMKIKTKSCVQHIRWMWLMLVVIGIVGCKDDKEEDAISAFDPGKSVVVSSFIPAEGGKNTRLVLYGDNFGNDISKIKVTIGEEVAKVISVRGQSLYCLVPIQANDGKMDIQVSILDANEDVMASAKPDSAFHYVRKVRVSTFLGDYKSVESEVVKKEGAFGDCGSFRATKWLTFDPQNPNHLYIACATQGCRLIDFEKKYVSNFTTGIDNVPCINWTLGGDMIVSRDQATDGVTGNYLFSRSSNFAQKNDLCVGRGLKNTTTHPINGELYFGRFRAGDFQRYDYDTREVTTVFQNTYAGVAFLIIMHPTGKYAYIVESERHYIMRADYDWDTKNLIALRHVCGAAGSSGYVDGMAGNARLNWPWQGVFVKNPDYVKAGLEDEYDFYFCDKSNHAIRILTPQGLVETYAGRGNNGTSGYADGDLRLQARFNNPESIVYDEVRKCFYVGDSNNYVIRKIGE